MSSYITSVLLNQVFMVIKCFISTPDIPLRTVTRVL